MRAMRRNPAKFFNASIDTNRKTIYTSRTGSKVQPDKQSSKGLIMRISIVKSNGRKIRTLDNPLNTWVRSVDDGKLYRVDR